MSKTNHYVMRYETAKRTLGEQNSSLLQVQHAVTQTLSSTQALSSQQAIASKQLLTHSANIPMLATQSEELQKTNLVSQWNSDSSGISLETKQRTFSLLQQKTEDRYPSKDNADINDSEFLKQKINISKSYINHVTKLSDEKLFEHAKKTIELHDQNGFIKFFKSMKNISYKDDFNRTLLTYALEENFTQVIEEILRTNRDIEADATAVMNIIDSDHNIALNYATKCLPLTRKNISFIEEIAEYTEEIDHAATSDDGNTPLHSLLGAYINILGITTISEISEDDVMPSYYIHGFIEEFIGKHRPSTEIKNTFGITAQDILNELNINFTYLATLTKSDYLDLAGSDSDTDESEGF